MTRGLASGWTIRAPTLTPEPAQPMPPPDGFVSLMGRLTALVSDTIIALVKHGALSGSRQLDMGNSG